MKQLNFLLIIAFALSMAGCGGGGGGSKSAIKATKATLEIKLTPGQAEIINKAVGKAAETTPVPSEGGVTQSSKGDKLAITNLKRSAGDVYTYAATNTGSDGKKKWSLTEKDELKVDVPIATADGWSKVALLRKKTAKGAVVAIAATDIKKSGDTDYLAGGFWIYAPDDAAKASDYEAGAFVDSGDPFAKDKLAALTGTATYTRTGGANGFAVAPKSKDLLKAFFSADVALTANFGDGSALGSVSGEVSNFKMLEKGSKTLDGMKPLTLGSAPITNANNGGFFNGDTSSGEYKGKWGGKFYGNSPTGHPGSAAGTFGATDGETSIIGVFAAGKE